MKENVKKLFGLLGVDQATISALEADELPEDFNLEDAAKQHISKRRELILNDGDLQKDMKKKYSDMLYPAIVKPLLKELQRSSGLSSEQIKAITEEGKSLPDMKKAVSMAFETFSKTTAGSVDEVKKELFEWKSKYENAATDHTKQIDELKAGFQATLKRDKVTRHFEKVVSGLDLTVPNTAANTLLTTDLMNSYNFDVDDKGVLQVFTKEGNKVDDGSNFLSASDVIKSRAEEFKILKKSNGGGGNNNNANTNRTNTGNGKESDAIRRMREAANRRR